MKAQSVNPSEEKSLGLEEETWRVCFIYSKGRKQRVCFSQRVYMWEYLCTTNIEAHTHIVFVCVCKKRHRQREICLRDLLLVYILVCFTVYLGNSRVERVPSGLMR